MQTEIERLKEKTVRPDQAPSIPEVQHDQTTLLPIGVSLPRLQRLEDIYISVERLNCLFEQ